ncbi:MAG: hypothetical protein ABL973_18260 [Micropepsaceae bacterium]
MEDIGVWIARHDLTWIAIWVPFVICIGTGVVLAIYAGRKESGDKP